MPLQDDDYSKLVLRLKEVFEATYMAQYVHVMDYYRSKFGPEKLKFSSRFFEKHLQIDTGRKC